jgi:diaminopimelate decarboxylase
MTETTRYTPENAQNVPYLKHVEAKYGHLPIWDYLKYDQEGNLWFNGVRLMDIVNNEHGGTPLEIVDPSIAEARSRQWAKLARKVKRDTGYEGRLTNFYATKAAGAAEIMAAAVKAGWQLETSSEQDLINIEWAYDNGL